MRHAIAAVVAMLILVVQFAFLAGSPNEPAQAADPIVNCSDIVVGQQIRIKCTAAGIVVLNTGVDLPVIEIPVPGPTSTRTIKVSLPGDRETVRVPGPTKTVTIPGQPGATVTAPGTKGQAGPTVTITKPGRTAPAKPGVTVTVKPNGKPVPTVTATTTVTATPSAEGTRGGTIDPAPEDDTVVTIPETRLDTPEAVGVGALSVLILATLILLGMYAGYYMGYKDSDKAEAKFLKSLLSR